MAWTDIENAHQRTQQRSRARWQDGEAGQLISSGSRGLERTFIHHQRDGTAPACSTGFYGWSLPGRAWQGMVLHLGFDLWDEAPLQTPSNIGISACHLLGWQVLYWL